MIFSVRDEQGEVIKIVSTEEEAKAECKDKKGWTYKKIGKIWP